MKGMKTLIRELHMFNDTIGSVVFDTHHQYKLCVYNEADAEYFNKWIELGYIIHDPITFPVLQAQEQQHLVMLTEMVMLTEKYIDLSVLYRL